MGCSNNHSYLRLGSAIAALAGLLLAACGGGGSSGGNQVGGIDGSGSPITSTAGTISGFGSVIVNGVRYHSDKAQILINDLPGTEDDLRAGYRVNITGTINTDGSGEASRIDFYSSITGAISAINTATEQVTLLGQTVRVSNATLFSSNINPNFIDGLKIGDKVQVSGPTDDQGIINATRIDLITSNKTQVLGTIRLLSSSTFNINELTVNFASAMFKNVTNNQLQNGVRVFIEGTTNSAGELVAQTIHQLEKDVRSGSKRAEVEGFISKVTSTTDYTEYEVGDTLCSVNNSTQYEGGTRENIALGAQVEVEGNVDANGKLAATKITFHTQILRAIAGSVTRVESTTTNNIVTGTLVVSGMCDLKSLE